MAYIQVSMMSQCLMRTVNITVVLPADKVPRQPLRPFKTLYLLHGIFGSQYDWINGTNVQRWADEKDLAVVMPAGENMFYVDQQDAHSLYGQFIGQELVELTRRMFPLSPRREDTFIAGLSMGGYGALRNGLKYMDNFGCIAGLSSANIVENIEKRTDDVEWYWASHRFAQAVFGDLDKVRGSDMDLFALAESCKASGKPLPRVYLACGEDDSLLEVNHHLRDCFLKNGFDLTWEEGPGAHEWDFWNRHIKRVIDWLPLAGEAGIDSGNVGLEKK
ncbi:MAG: acetylesterase [Clostridia bacterium]|nr:acetylesterase [Clostridia bacterium]